jgi:hypothetical protein
VSAEKTRPQKVMNPVLLAETGPECYILSDEEGFARMKEAEEG